MPTPFPTQLSGAMFLAQRQNALLADQPRVGKTGSAIIATDYILAEKVLVITTASGRPVWRRGLDAWSIFPRPVQVLTNSSKLDPRVPSAIVGWPSLANPNIRSQLMRRDWDVVIPDESHWGKSIEAKRTAACYGDLLEDGKHRVATNGAIARAARVWCLTGSPIPNAPNDLYPMMRALCPERLAAFNGFPDVTLYPDFLERYCVVKPKQVGNFRWIKVVIGGRNLQELRDRLGDFMLLRTQADVGIRPPLYETFPLEVTPKMLREAEGQTDRTDILKAAEAGDTRALEMHMGPLRRVTGTMKAVSVADAIEDEILGGLDKVVLAYWHKDVGDILEAKLAKYGVLRLDGSTPANMRGPIEQQWLNDPKKQVFLGQIQAAGEAIDLSAAAELMFVETSFVPKDMQQMSLRITNHEQKRQARVRVAVLEGSVDEALETVLLRKWSVIREVLTDASRH